MKVLLTHGYFLNEDSTEQRIMKPYAPLGILYISAYLKEHGIDNNIFDTTFSSKNELKKYLVDERPDYIAIYVNLMTKINVLDIIKYIKSTDSIKNAKIILGGPEVRYNATDLLELGADFVVIGEGEETTLELINRLEMKNRNDFKNINGIGFKDDNGKIIFNAERSLISDIDTLPFPNRSGIDIRKYQEAWKNHHNLDAISVSTMRGCPYTCRWCSRAVYGLTCIETGTFIMLGYPGETEKDIEETISHLKKSNPDLFTITVAYPIRGTELFQEIETNQVNFFDWEKQTDRDRDFVRTYPRRYYDFAVHGLIKPEAVKYKSKSFAAKTAMWFVRNTKWLSSN
ncbi:MAG: radical protein [Ignavibacteriaceae bacterium]|nr:radical protein [Ignavibacteriaceae bacterium]